MSRPQFSLPETQVPKDVIDRVQFSVSSRNAGSKVSECLAHVFVSPYCDDPAAINWQYVSSGVTCLLRKKEVGKSGRKLVWTVHMCLYNVTYGVLVWKGAVPPNSCYTAVTDTFHVYVMHELNAVVGLLFDEASQAREFLRAYIQWDAEKVKEERAKGGGGGGSSSPAQFRKEMISKPCNFQHIQGTQALDECIEIEKIKTDIQATFFGLGSARARDSKSGGGKRKKDAGRPRLQLQNISVPHRVSRRGGGHMAVESSKSLDVEMVPGSRLPAELKAQESVPAEMGLRHSMPAQVALHHHHHQSQPNLLNDLQSGGGELPSPPPTTQPMSPQYDILAGGRHSSDSGVESSAPDASPLDKQPRTAPGGLLYDTLQLNGKEDQLPVSAQRAVPLQNGSDRVVPHSPVYDAPIRAESPVYDSLQKNTTRDHPPAELTDADRRYKPQLDKEVAGYSMLTGEKSDGNLNLSSDYSPPPRLSPLSFEKEFGQSPFFHPAFVTSTTNC
jgi:hypothetical protein